MAGFCNRGGQAKSGPGRLDTGLHACSEGVQEEIPEDQLQRTTAGYVRSSEVSLSTRSRSERAGEHGRGPAAHCKLIAAVQYTEYSLAPCCKLHHQLAPPQTRFKRPPPGSSSQVLQ